MVPDWNNTDAKGILDVTSYSKVGEFSDGQLDMQYKWINLSPVWQKF